MTLHLQFKAALCVACLLGVLVSGCAAPQDSSSEVVTEATQAVSADADSPSEPVTGKADELDAEYLDGLEYLAATERFLGQWEAFSDDLVVVVEAKDAQACSEVSFEGRAALEQFIVSHNSDSGFPLAFAGSHEQFELAVEHLYVATSTMATSFMADDIDAAQNVMATDLQLGAADLTKATELYLAERAAFEARWGLDIESTE